MYALPAPAPSPVINNLRGEPILAPFPSFTPFPSPISYPFATSTATLSSTSGVSMSATSSFTSSFTSSHHTAFHLRHTITELISENGVNIHDVINYELYKVSAIIFLVLTVSVLIMFMLNYLVHKHKMALMYPDLDKLYKERANKVNAKVKAKQSPYIEPMPDSPVLPRCLKLESAEKGQNVLFRYSSPYRRTVNINADGFVPEKRDESPQETRITILVD